MLDQVVAMANCRQLLPSSKKNPLERRNAQQPGGMLGCSKQNKNVARITPDHNRARGEVSTLLLAAASAPRQ